MSPKHLALLIAATATAIIGCAQQPVALPTTPPASARTSQVEAAEMFAEWDVNRDGMLTPEEFPYAARVYELMAQKADGKLDREAFVRLYLELYEYLDSVLDERLGWFLLHDTDRNGRLDARELVNVPGAISMLRQYDVNRDDVITLEEVEMMRLPPQRWRPLKRALKLAHGFQRYDRDKSGALETRELGRDLYLIEKLDANADGKLQLSELRQVEKLWQGGPKAFERYALELKFNRLDARKTGRLRAEDLGRDAKFSKFLDQNGDGFITLEEYMSLPEASMRLLTRLTPPPPPPKGREAK